MGGVERLVFAQAELVHDRFRGLQDVLLDPLDWHRRIKFARMHCDDQVPGRAVAALLHGR